MDELKQENKELRKKIKSMRMLLITTAVSLIISQIGNLKMFHSINQELECYMKTEAALLGMVIRKNHLQEEALQILLESQEY